MELNILLEYCRLCHLEGIKATWIGLKHYARIKHFSK